MEKQNRCFLHCPCGGVLIEKDVKKGVFWDVTPCGSRHTIPEDTILLSHRLENLKSYEKDVVAKSIYIYIYIKACKSIKVNAWGLNWATLFLG
jgi:hypothetical protein